MLFAFLFIAARSWHIVTGYDNNTYLQMTLTYAELTQQKNCYICSHIPTNTETGIPFLPYPLGPESVCEIITAQQVVKNLTESSLTNNKAVFSSIHWESPTCSQTVNVTQAYRKYNYKVPLGENAPFLRVFPLKGGLCVQRENLTNGIQVGNSKCNHTISCQHTITQIKDTTTINNSQGRGMGQGLAQVLQVLVGYFSNMSVSLNVTKLNDHWKGMWSWYNCYNAPLPTMPGVYWVCGDKAYPRLPDRWSGSCYLAYVIPAMRHLQELALPFRMKRNAKDAFPEVENVLEVVTPGFDVYMLNDKVEALKDLIETVANNTSDAFSSLSAEMQALHTMVLQNRIALDSMLAEKGGVCKLIGSECCIYIPDSSSNVSVAIQHVKESGRTLNESWESWSSGSWLGSFWIKIVYGLIISIVILLLIYVVFSIILGIKFRSTASTVPSFPSGVVPEGYLAPHVHNLIPHVDWPLLKKPEPEPLLEPKNAGV
ncbi:syncytin-1-like [Rhinophrynus dorsalis]